MLFCDLSRLSRSLFNQVDSLWTLRLSLLKEWF